VLVGAWTQKKKQAFYGFSLRLKRHILRKMNDCFRYSFLSLRARVVFFLLDEKRRFFGFEKRVRPKISQKTGMKNITYVSHISLSVTTSNFTASIGR